MQFTVRSSDFLQTFFVCFLVIFWYFNFFGNGNGSVGFPPSRLSLKAPYSFSSFPRLVPFHHCEISHVVAVFRHTTRLPTAKNVQLFSRMESLLRDQQYAPGYDWLRNWTNQFSIDNAGEISEAGRLEAELIGKRFGRGYLGYFGRYSPHSYEVNSTYKNRTYQTAQAFLTGLFGADSNSQFEITRNPESDPVLRFFDECHKYNSVCLEAKKKAEELEYDSRFSDLVHNLNSRLGDKVNFSFSDINALWRICGMEFLSARSSRICDLFSDQESLLFEYYYDQITYLTKSNGYPINVKMSCILLKTIVAKLELALKGGDGVRASFYFAHAETLVPLLALLNISTDSLLVEKPLGVLPKRNYVFGVLVPMGANLAFNLATCGNGEVYLTITLNEQLVLIGNNSQSSVLLSDFFKLTNSLLDSCDLDSICSLPGSDSV